MRRPLLPLLLFVPIACASPETQRELANNVADVAHLAPEPSDLPAEPPRPPAPPPVATPGPEAPPVLDTLAPWFTEPPLSEALEAWEGNERERALAIFDAFALAHPEDSRALPARFYAAWLAAEPDDAAAPAVAVLSPQAAMLAAERFQTLALDWPLMADIATLRAAELLAIAADTDTDARKNAFATLDRLPSDSSYLGRALALRTRLLVAEPGGREVARLALEEAANNDPARLLPASWDELASLRAANDKAAGDRAQLELAVRFPNDALGKAALKALDVGKLKGTERLRLGRALFDGYRYDAMRAVLGGLKTPKTAACEAYILLGRAAERKKKDDDQALTKAFEFYKKALPCEGEARADATFLGGRALITAKPKEARKLLEEHAKEFPERSTADDALLLLAETEKRPKNATRQLLSTLRRYPKGDMADAVAWDLVGPNVEARKWKQVLDTTQQVLDIAPNDVPGRHPGRFRYWHARAAWELGNKDKARAEWRTVFAQNPLSWYALLAYSRLVSPATQEAANPETNPETPEAMRAELVPPVPEIPGPPDLRVPAAVWQDVHFRRAIEWARLSGSNYDRSSPFLSNVDLELDAVAAKARPDGDDWVWMRIAVQQLGGGFPRSMRLARTLEANAKLPFPVGLAALPWKLAYPRPFLASVTKWATERTLDPYWIWSVMRVESNFDPEAVSWANAIGLMQIIMPTAKNLARNTEHEATRENLMRPAVAIELGSKYLQRLLGRHKVVPLASAGYNAGGGAVSKWRKQFGNIDIDEFVERIPYREAHLYAKSVTQTLARYRWLYEGTLMALDLTPVGSPDAVAPATE